MARIYAEPLSTDIAVDGDIGSGGRLCVSKPNDDGGSNSARISDVELAWRRPHGSVQLNVLDDRGGVSVLLDFPIPVPICARRWRSLRGLVNWACGYSALPGIREWRQPTGSVVLDHCW